jgi:hypothetical protein
VSLQYIFAQVCVCVCCSVEAGARGRNAHPRLCQSRRALGEKVVAILARHVRVLCNVLVNLPELGLQDDLAGAERIENVQQMLTLRGKQEGQVGCVCTWSELR